MKLVSIRRELGKGMPSFCQMFCRSSIAKIVAIVELAPIFRIRNC